VAHGFLVELDGVQHGLTHDVSRSGFSALLVGGFAVDRLVPFVLQLACGEPPVRGAARVVSSVKEARGADPCSTRARVSFAISEIDPEDAVRLERVLFETAWPRLAAGDTEGAPFLSSPR
jgi:hypothetical protein